MGKVVFNKRFIAFCLFLLLALWPVIFIVIVSPTPPEHAPQEERSFRAKYRSPFSSKYIMRHLLDEEKLMPWGGFIFHMPRLSKRHTLFLKSWFNEESTLSVTHRPRPYTMRTAPKDLTEEMDHR